MEETNGHADTDTDTDPYADADQDTLPKCETRVRFIFCPAQGETNLDWHLATSYHMVQVPQLCIVPVAAYVVFLRPVLQH